MTDRDPDVAPDDRVTDPQPVGPPRGAPRRRGHSWRRWLILGALVVILAPVAIFALWSTIALHYTYSDGMRTGYVQKFSRKGWLCKTWEGELAQSNFPGQMQQMWAFSVRDDSIARVIEQSMGKGQLSLHYDQHPHVPSSCFGDTEYFVDRVEVMAR